MGRRPGTRGGRKVEHGPRESSQAIRMMDTMQPAFCVYGLAVCSSDSMVPKKQPKRGRLWLNDGSWGDAWLMVHRRGDCERPAGRYGDKDQRPVDTRAGHPASTRSSLGRMVGAVSGTFTGRKSRHSLTTYSVKAY
jgi:hypothetical protein